MASGSGNRIEGCPPQSSVRRRQNGYNYNHRSSQGFQPSFTWKLHRYVFIYITPISDSEVPVITKALHTCKRIQEEATKRAQCFQRQLEQAMVRTEPTNSSDLHAKTYLALDQAPVRQQTPTPKQALTPLRKSLVYSLPMATMNNIDLLSLSSITFGVTLVWEGVGVPNTLISPIYYWPRQPSAIMTLGNQLVRCLPFMFCKVG